MSSGPKKVLTLCLLQRGDQFALAKKLRGFGSGKWNGYGGHVEEKESERRAAVREVLEETGGSVKVEPADLKQKAQLTFYFANDPVTREVHVFVVDRWEGEPRASEEMGEPRWITAADLAKLEQEMWAADQLWLPRVLAGESIYGVFSYSVDGRRVESHTIIPAHYF